MFFRGRLGFLDQSILTRVGEMDDSDKMKKGLRPLEWHFSFSGRFSRSDQCLSRRLSTQLLQYVCRKSTGLVPELIFTLILFYSAVLKCNIAPFFGHHTHFICEIQSKGPAFVVY